MDLEQPNRDQLNDIANGDYPDNGEVDSSCAKRLLRLCRDYGKDGEEAEQLLRMACKRIEVFI